MVEACRLVAPLFRCLDGETPPASPRQLEIVEIDRYKAKELNMLWHSRLPQYETGFCVNALISFGAIYQNVYYAIAIWSNPVARALPQHTWLELRRLAIAADAPKYTATRMLGQMRKQIARRFPQVTTLISYQDCAAHTGTIYRADNWTATASHAGGTWDRPHSTNLNGTPRTRPDLNESIGPKVRWQYELLE